MVTGQDEFKPDELTAGLAVLRERLRQGEQPEVFTLLGEERVLSYEQDQENGDAEYAFIEFGLEADFLAEIEYGTFGHLQGFRIYY